MADWNTIIENYESNDCESLGEYAAELMYELMGYFKNYDSDRKAAEDALLCAFYFLNIDNFVDGGEEDVLRYAIADWEFDYNFPLMQKNFRANGLDRYIENKMYDAPGYVREIFARLGCALFSGKGYVSDEERSVIFRWV